MTFRFASMWRGKRAASAVVAGVSLVALSACGSASGIASSNGAELTKANFAQKLRAAQSSDQSVHVQATFGVGGQHMTMSGDLAMSGMALGDLRADLIMRVAGKSAEMRIVSGDIYLNGGALGMSTSSGKPWVKVNLNDPMNPLGGAYNQMLKELSPSAMTKAFAAISSLDNVGTETVDGVTATHYIVTLSTAKALRLLGVDRVGGTSLGQLTAPMPKKLSYDVWVGPSHLMVRMKASIEGSEMDMHFSDWGKHVTVKTPPASQVSTVSF
ncbi:MAG: hypothetical protein ACRDPG_08355 [Nocardioidaceae bacterium]